MQNKNYEKIKNIIGYSSVFILIAFIIGFVIVSQLNEPKELKFSDTSFSSCLQICEKIGWDDSKWNGYVSSINGGFNGIDDMCESFSCSENKPISFTEETTQKQTFQGYECTSDCSGHKAGYNWAKEKSIEEYSNCGGHSNSFIEGCKAYVSEEFNFWNNE